MRLKFIYRSTAYLFVIYLMNCIRNFNEFERKLRDIENMGFVTGEEPNISKVLES